MRIAVVGSGGQLGAAIVHECAAAHEVVGLPRKALDVTSDAAIAETIARLRPDAIVNCAAFNHVDAAEDQPVQALAVNAFAVRGLAREAERLGAVLVHYGSDFVFDGTVTRPYAEDHRPSPRSVYGASKMLGEWFALDVPRGYVLRVESLFGRAPDGPPAKGSVAAIAEGLLSGSEPRVFVDRIVSPTHLPDAARATRRLLEMLPEPGLYHCVNSGHCTWEEFALALAGQLGVEPRVTPVHMADVPMRAQRPLFSALSNAKLRQAGIEMPTWQDAIADYARTLTASRSPSVG